HAGRLGREPLARWRHRAVSCAGRDQARPHDPQTQLISPRLRAALQASVSEAAGVFRIEHVASAGGGCIHRCFILEGGGRRYFAKVNARAQLDNFAAEADGLTALAGGARVPSPVCRGEEGGEAFLVLEYLE